MVCQNSPPCCMERNMGSAKRAQNLNSMAEIYTCIYVEYSFHIVMIYQKSPTLHETKYVFYRKSAKSEFYQGGETYI